LTLLLGPPGSGKTTLLLALAGRLDKDLKVVQNVSLHFFAIVTPRKKQSALSRSLHFVDIYFSLLRTSAQNWAFKKQGIFHRQLLHALYELL
jgi:ABC-type multidrug transport system ATPase subunit